MQLESLYKDGKLYKINAQPQAGQTPVLVPAGFNGTAVLFEYEASATLPENLQGFLNKVIEGGMKLQSAQVLFANTFYTDATLQKIAEETKAQTVILFGTKWLNHLKNINVSKNDIVKLYGMKVLVTDSLDVIHNSDAAKKAFWKELKKIF